MRNIEASPWMGQADLSKTENSHDASRMPYSFGLTVALQRPKQDDGTGTGASGAAPASSAAVQPKATTPSTTARTPASPSATPVNGGAK
jgi:type IV pilus assembly protein PilN